MLPGLYVPLERLPVTPNGKVDHRALPIPAASGPAARRRLRFPALGGRAGARRHLAGGPGASTGSAFTNDFFELGGNPLLGTLVVTQVHERFGLPLPLRSFLSGRRGRLASWSGRRIEAGKPNRGRS